MFIGHFLAVVFILRVWKSLKLSTFSHERWVNDERSLKEQWAIAERTVSERWVRAEQNWVSNKKDERRAHTERKQERKVNVERIVNARSTIFFGTPRKLLSYFYLKKKAYWNF